jgi:hypothetical protein
VDNVAEPDKPENLPHWPHYPIFKKSNINKSRIDNKISKSGKKNKRGTLLKISPKTLKNVY